MAGIATFPTMAYITVQSNSFQQKELAWDSALFLRQQSPSYRTLIMGLWLIGPWFSTWVWDLMRSISVLFRYGYTFQQALAAVFVAGIVFIVERYAPKYIINSIQPMKLGVGAGIRLFLHRWFEERRCGC